MSLADAAMDARPLPHGSGRFGKLSVVERRVEAELPANDADRRDLG